MMSAITKMKLVSLHAAFVTAFISLAQVSFAESHGACYQQTFQAVCESMRADRSVNPATSYGEVVANPFGTPKSRSHSQEIGLRVRTEDEMKSLFTSAKRNLLKQLFGSHTPDQLSKDAQSVYGRIASSLYLGRENSLRKAFCAGAADNAAFFGRYVNGMVLCDDMSRNPTVSVLEVLSHEITHSLDTVNMRKNFYLADKEPIQYVPGPVSNWKNPRVLQAIDNGLATILPGVKSYSFQHAIDVFVSGSRGLPKMKPAHLKEAIPDSFGALAVKNHFQELKAKNPSYKPTPVDLIAPFGSTIEQACGVDDSPMEGSEEYASFALRFEAIYMADPYLAEVYNCPWLSTGEPLHDLR